MTERAEHIARGPRPSREGSGCGDACVTCADEALPVRVVRLLDDDLAVVNAGGVDEEVSVALVDAAVGDTVLVHAKEAIAVTARAVTGRDEEGRR